MIDPENIGLFAADAFGNPQDHVGRQLEIASDELTGPQMAEVFERVSGIPTHFHEQDLEQLRQFSAEMAVMYEWFNQGGYRADIPALRALHPELTTLETWARQEWTPGAVAIAADQQRRVACLHRGRPDRPGVAPGLLRPDGPELGELGVEVAPPLLERRSRCLIVVGTPADGDADSHSASGDGVYRRQLLGRQRAVARYGPIRIAIVSPIRSVAAAARVDIASKLE